MNVFCFFLNENGYGCDYRFGLKLLKLTDFWVGFGYIDPCRFAQISKFAKVV